MQSKARIFFVQIVFAVFVVDMSVVLMNLVLGLAVSDIEELQRNSAVRRMMQAITMSIIARYSRLRNIP